MADKTARNVALLAGAAVGGYLLWKYARKDAAATTETTTETPTKETPKGTIMTHILHLDSSARGSASHSRTISGELVQAMKDADPTTTVTYRDLGHQDIPYVSEEFIGAMYTPKANHTTEQKATLALSDEMIAELFAADTYVIGIPMYNFSVPGVFKSYIDQVTRIGETWSRDPFGGLLKNKKAIIVTARGGGGYGPGEAREAYNVQDPTVKNIFGFMGVTDLEFIHVNNTAAGDDAANGALAEARAKIAALVSAE